MDDESKELVDEQAYSWLEMHKKSAVSYLVLEALSEKKMWSKELVDWITKRTAWTITEKGLYRVLRRMQKQGSIIFDSQAAARTGAERKIYQMTTEGTALLQAMRKELGYLERQMSG